MKKILFVGAEAMPFAATGGLGDVMGSLPAAIAAADPSVDVRVVLPLYAQVSDTWRAQMKQEAVFNVPLAWRNQYCAIYSLVKDSVTYYFVDNEYYFKRDTLYGQLDDGERYAYFCKAALEMMRHLDYYPDILHAHDWQAALSVVYLNTKYRYVQTYQNICSVFTIHNIEYQGKFDLSILGDIFELGFEHYSLMNYNGCINLMKAAIECADRVSTVSPRYAEEILTPEYAHGLHYCLCNHTDKLCGILNGIDYNYYNPKTDDVIEQHFSSVSISRKYANKIALQKAYGLPEDPSVPLLAIISRLATHKGLDLITEIAYNLMKEQNAQLVILGKGEKCYEEYFVWLQSQFPDKVRALIEYDRNLALRIYAACDIFLMPSHSEPCGLSQMIASRYGAIPVTRETGGLYDSIKGYWKDDDGEIHGNGFTFANYSPDELAERTCAAIALYENTKDRKALIRKIMETDFSWNISAKRYLEMYNSI